jgi:hypothetical protein
VGAALRAGRGDELLDSAVSVEAEAGRELTFDPMQARLRSDRGAAAVEPGLYIVLQYDETAAQVSNTVVIAGFWLVIDGDYLVNGPAGPPDRVPPFAQEMLDGATEEVWWRNLKVLLAPDRSWRPVMVIEYLPHFAQRSSMPPPGVPNVEPEARELEEDDDHRETWLDIPAARAEPVWNEANAEWEKGADAWAHLPRDRSVIVVIRGLLTHNGTLHTGTYFLVPPDLLDPDASTAAIPLGTWFERALALKPIEFSDVERSGGDRHHLGAPLQLADGRVGFASSAWLTRGLSIWPARPSDITIGTLTDRVVQQRWIQQARLALMSSTAVLLFVLSFSYIVVLATMPQPATMVLPPEPARQPALSVCSAAYPEFIEEFRCQIAHLASSEDNGGSVPVCRDKSSRATGGKGIDLQATYCALRDRERDGRMAVISASEGANAAHFAASQACFNVLGHPYPYYLHDIKAGGFSKDGGGRAIGNPVAFLEDDALRIDPLKELVDELDEICDGYAERIASVVEGAIFATHIGAPYTSTRANESDPARLRRELFGIASVGMTDNNRACFQRGMSEGLSGTQLSTLCSDEPDAFVNKNQEKPIWVELGGEMDPDTASVVLRYAKHRFPKTNPKTDELWSCHLALASDQLMVAGDRTGRWEIPVPVPSDYRVQGAGVTMQLTFDAFWWATEGSTDPKFGHCWPVVRKRLSGYRPVHPLLSELNPEGWPSEEQQLCGQICAAKYALKRSVNDSAWYTRDSDLAACLLLDSAGPDFDEGIGKLDLLRMPWNDDPQDWKTPDPAHVCAFNVIAQDLMPPIEGGYVVQERAGKEYAGETVAGSRIAGGTDGLAARYVTGLGRLESVTSAAACGNVATQCFTGLFLEVSGDSSVERYRWLDNWRRKVEDLKQLKRIEFTSRYPWCVGIRDYLVPERESAQFDTPCVAGVEEARLNAEQAFALLAIETGNAAEGAN